jgi:rhodanese-related sulfurtransferase
MRRLLLLLAVGVVGLLSVGTLTACSSSATHTVTPEQAKSMISQGAGVLDVRTAEEFAQGHLTGAINIDVEGPDFGSRVGTLDKSATWVVYCHSGNRAGIAIDQMSKMGFTDLSNAGGFDALAGAGIAWEQGG